MLEVCQQAARTPDGRVFVEDKAVRQKLRNICNPLELGQMSETHFVLGTSGRTTSTACWRRPTAAPHGGGPAAVDGTTRRAGASP